MPTTKQSKKTYVYRHHHGLAVALMAIVTVIVAGVPIQKSLAGSPTVYAPQGAQSGGWFTAPFSFHIYINCQSGVQFEQFYTGSLEGINTYHFDTSTDGSLLVRFNAGGEQLIYSCGNPNGGIQPLVSYTTKLDTQAPNVTISMPASGTQTGVTSIVVSGVATDSASGVQSVTINGAAASLSGNSFQGTANLAVGTNVLTSTATDAAGHTDSSTTTVIRPVPATNQGQTAGASRTSLKQPTPTTNVRTSTPVPSPTPNQTAITPSNTPTPIIPTEAKPSASVQQSTKIARPISYTPVSRVQMAIPVIVMALAIGLLVFVHTPKPKPARKRPLKP